MSESAQNFFVRLMLRADDYGYYHNNPVLLKSYLYPYMPLKTIEEVTSHLNECYNAKDEKGAPLIVNRGKYLEITNFGQRLRLKKSSKYKNDGHVSGIRQTSAVKKTSSPSPSSSTSLKEKGGTGEGENEADRLMTPAEVGEIVAEVTASLTKVPGK
jgi:hypothetical protein